MNHQCDKEEIINFLIEDRKDFRELFVNEMEKLNDSIRDLAVQKNEINHLKEYEKQHIQFEKKTNEKLESLDNRASKLFMKKTVDVVFYLIATFIGGAVTYFSMH